MSNTKTKKISKKQPINKAHKTKLVNRSTISRRSRLMKLVKRHRLVTVLLSILLYFAFSTLYQSYKVWDNARLIRGMFRDFPLIVAEVEQATGIDLKYDVECSVTTEKFGKGVNTCEFLVKSGHEAISITVDTILNSKNISGSYKADSGKGYRVEYMNKRNCSLSSLDYMSFSCIIPVKNENMNLAKQLYVDQKNEQKTQILN